MARSKKARTASQRESRRLPSEGTGSVKPVERRSTAPLGEEVMAREPERGGRGRWVMAGAVALVCAGVWVGVQRGAPPRDPTTAEATGAARPSPSASVASDSSDEAESGYWGEITMQDITLRLPEGYVTADECNTAGRPWVIEQVSGASEADQRLATAGLTPSLRASLRGGMSCTGASCQVMPSDDVLGAMTPAMRAGVMRLLAPFTPNEEYRYPFLRARRFGPWSETAWARPAVRAMFERIHFESDDQDAVVDVAYACRNLAELDARREFLEVLKVRYGLATQLRVDTETPLGPLVAWYGRQGRASQVREVLESAQRGPRRVSLHELLPPLARVRHDTFPRRDEPAYDCFWSALHFFDGPSASTHLPGNDGFRAALQSGYRRIAMDELRFGDVLVFIDHAGLPSHAVNVVTPTLVFTKNGGSFRRPWVIMRLQDVRDQYPNVTDVQAWRRRGA